MPAGLAERELGLRHAAEPDRAQVDDLAPRAVHAEAVELLVKLVEPLLEAADAGRADLVRVDRDGDLVALPVVAHVGGVRDRPRVGRDPLALEPVVRAAAELVEDPGHLGRLGLREQPDVRLGELVAEVGDEIADGAEQAGRRRHEDRERPHQLGDGVCVERPGAAVGDEREVARVVAALDGDEAQRARHVLVHDREDSLRGLLGRREAHRVGDRLHRGARRLDVERHLAAEQLRRQVPEHDVRVGHRRQLAAPAVGGRAGGGARRLRPDAQRLRQLGHVGDRAATRADRVDVDGRDADAEVRDRRLAPDRRLPVLAERDVGGRPSHVEREDVLEAGLGGDEEGAGDTAGRPGEHRVDRVPCRLAGRHQPGVRAEDVHVRLRPDRLELGLEAIHVVGDLRPHVGVHAGRQRPLVLPELGQHLGAERHREARVEALDDGADLLLVGWVHVGVDECDGERLDARLDEVADDLLDLRLVDRDDDRTAGVQALDCLTRVGERRRRIGLDHDDPPRQRAGRLGAGEMEDLPEARRRDQPDARPLGLEHGVRRDGRAVKDVLQLVDADARLVADPPNAGEHALRRIVGRRRRLDAELRAAVALRYEEEVGERAADVNPQPVRHLGVLSVLAGDRLVLERVPPPDVTDREAHTTPSSRNSRSSESVSPSSPQ